MRSSIIAFGASSVIALIGMLFAAPVSAESIRVLTWNVESNRPESGGHFASGNSPEKIAEELTSLQQLRGSYDLIALTEVLAENASIYEAAAEATGRSYLPFISRAGATDRMVILVDENRFNVIDGEATELRSQGNITFPGNGARRPMFVQLEDSENNELEFIFMVNHLTRGNENNRRLQARGLREWAADQTLPIVAAGDYNFDFNFRNLTGNQSMAIFFEDNGGGSVWDWVIANAVTEVMGTGADQRTTVFANFVDTSWSDGNNQRESGERVDSFPGSILDFVLVAQGARTWNAQSRVIVRDNDFPDTEDTSDHRPVEAIFEPEIMD